MEYDTIVGLEIHVQTKTESKMFCSCPTGYFQKEPNTHVCPVCLGLPGALPVPNRRAIELCILMGLATNCTINKNILFDRKHYFYPDLPKGYQISQYKDPICSNGKVTLPSGVEIEIERIHQEEDVAKSTHHKEASTNKEYSLIDYNKSGIPLIEIVTKPCIRSAKDAKDFATEIQQICRDNKISDADMEKGQMRCEPNISIQEKGKWKYEDGKILPIGDYKLNNKVEVKNIGSITAVEKAIEYEVKRLTEEIANGKEIIQQTRGWNADKGITEFQRSKETADDYRYMPEPDIPVIEIAKEDIERISKELVESPAQRRLSFKEKSLLEKRVTELGYDPEGTAWVRENTKFSLEKAGPTGPSEPDYADFYFGPIKSHMNATGMGWDEISKTDPNTPNDYYRLSDAKKQGLITRNKLDEIYKESLTTGASGASILEKTLQESKRSASNLEDIVKEIIRNNPKAVADYKGGKTSTMGFLVGQVMQSTKGSANPNEAKNILEKLLK